MRTVSTSPFAATPATVPARGRATLTLALLPFLLAIAPALAAHDGDPPAAPLPPAAELDRPLSTAEQASHVLNRLAFGAKPGQLAELTRTGWKSWVEKQLAPASIDDSALETVLREHYPSLQMDLLETHRVYWPAPPENFEQLTEPERNQFFQLRNQLYYKLQRELPRTVLLRAVRSERQFEELMVEFWRNHFNIDQTKGECRLFANNYERTIRGHVFGRFEDLLLASARHPAMLVYLDNDVSQKPLTRQELEALEQVRKAQRKNPDAQLGMVARNLVRHRGLNENYARELMELHTLGVDNYYTQRDVYEVARALTGWSHGWKGENYDSEYGFCFRREVHDLRPKKILGTGMSGKGDEKEGRDIIRMLARHKGTAAFIAWKLCRYLVNDEPPRSLVTRVAQVFKKSKGDLPEVYRAIIFSPEFMERRNYRSKFKSPFEFVVSALRATDSRIESADDVLFRLARMGQPLYQCADPTGYFDQTEAWLDPGVLVHRWDFALSLMTGGVKGVMVPESLLAPLEEVDMKEARHRAVAMILPDEVDAATRKVFDRAWSLRRLVGLALGSPSFHKQ